MVGQKILMGCRFLERRVVTRNSLFIRQLTGKKQAFVGLSIGFWSHTDYMPSSKKYLPKYLKIHYAG